MDWGAITAVGLFIVGFMLERLMRIGDRQSGSQSNMAAMDVRMKAAEDWIKAHSDIAACTRELRSEVQNLKASFDRLDETLSAAVQFVQQALMPKPAAPEPTAAALALPPELMEGLRVLSRLSSKVK